MSNPEGRLARVSYLILPTGVVHELYFANCPSIEAIQQMLGVREVEHVSVLWQGERRHAFVDEMGHVREEPKPVNAIGTAIYHAAMIAARGGTPFSDIAHYADPDKHILHGEPTIAGAMYLWPHEAAGWGSGGGSHPENDPKQEAKQLHNLQLLMAISNYDIPGYMQESLLRYMTQGCPVGNFLACVLMNDLRGAVAHADVANKRNLAAYVQFLYNNAPTGCWGSVENYHNWIEKHRRELEARASAAAGYEQRIDSETGQVESNNEQA